MPALQFTFHGATLMKGKCRAVNIMSAPKIRTLRPTVAPLAGGGGKIAAIMGRLP
jgi:hypothetical protein